MRYNVNLSSRVRRMIDRCDDVTRTCCWTVDDVRYWEAAGSTGGYRVVASTGQTAQENCRMLSSQYLYLPDTQRGKVYLNWFQQINLPLFDSVFKVLTYFLDLMSCRQWQIRSRAELCRYCLVRRTDSYSGGGTSYWQFLLSQWRYAVYLRDSKCHKIPKCYAPNASRKLKIRQNSFSATGRAYYAARDPSVSWREGYLSLILLPLNAVGVSRSRAEKKFWLRPCP